MPLFQHYPKKYQAHPTLYKKIQKKNRFTNNENYDTPSGERNTQMKKIFFLIFLASCGPPIVDNKVIIKHDTGGLLQDYERVTALNPIVEIRGTCGSACTMLLSVTDLCVTKTARLGFHGAIPPTSNVESQRSSDMRMAIHYPPNIRKMYMDKWRHAPYSSQFKFFYLSGQEYISLTGTKECAKT